MDFIRCGCIARNYITWGNCSGAGSFCSTRAAGRRWSHDRFERRRYQAR
jgi:hypothetical protein